MPFLPSVPKPGLNTTKVAAPSARAAPRRPAPGASMGAGKGRPIMPMAEGGKVKKAAKKKPGKK